VLDRQIRDAAPRVEPVGRREGPRRTGIETGAAGAAMVGLDGVGRELEREEYLAEEKPGAEFLRDEVGVLALPADAGALGERLFHDRRGVDEHFQLARPGLGDPARQRL